MNPPGPERSTVGTPPSDPEGDRLTNGGPGGNEEDAGIPDSPLLTASCGDPELRGWVVVHSYGDGGSCGGVRLYPDVSVEEVSLLARAMTYKYCFYERRTGGAKAALQLPFGLPVSERRRLLRRFGSCIGPLIHSRLYTPWTDMNCGAAELEEIMAGAGLPLPALGDSSSFTALSTFAAITATCAHLGVKPHGASVTIEGLGSVGSCLAREIASWGARIIGVSNRLGAVANTGGLDVEEVLSSRSRHGEGWVLERGGWESISSGDLASMPATVHVPCARVHSITPRVAEGIGARAVVPAANVPCTDAGEHALEHRGVSLLPDFVVNGGGVVGTALTDLGLSSSRIRRVFLEDFRDMVSRLLALSRERGVPPVIPARELAHASYRGFRRSAASASSEGALRGIYRAARRRGLVPGGAGRTTEADRLLRLLRDRFRES